MPLIKSKNVEINIAILDFWKFSLATLDFQQNCQSYANDIICWIITKFTSGLS